MKFLILDYELTVLFSIFDGFIPLIVLFFITTERTGNVTETGSSRHWEMASDLVVAFHSHTPKSKKKIDINISCDKYGISCTF